MLTLGQCAEFYGGGEAVLVPARLLVELRRPQVLGSYGDTVGGVWGETCERVTVVMTAVIWNFSKQLLSKYICLMQTEELIGQNTIRTISIYRETVPVMVCL